MVWNELGASLDYPDDLTFLGNEVSWLMVKFSRGQVLLEAITGENSIVEPLSQPSVSTAGGYATLFAGH